MARSTKKERETKRQGLEREREAAEKTTKCYRALTDIRSGDKLYPEGAVMQGLTVAEAEDLVGRGLVEEVDADAVYERPEGEHRHLEFNDDGSIR